MDGQNILAESFEAHRGRLRAVAYRMLGSAPEAEDAVQEAWLRLSRAEAAAIDNLSGWLTTVVARICLDMLRARKARREEPIIPGTPEPIAEPTDQEAMLADSIGVALLVVLDTLNPAERVAFVLHDMFDLPFEDIAPIVDRTPAAARQLASRARRRVKGAQPDEEDVDTARQREIVDAFLAASKSGDLAALLRILDPAVVFRPDAVAARMGGVGELRGADAVAATFKGRAQAAKPALLDGAPGLAVAFHGQLRVALRLTFAGERIAGIEAVADPAQLKAMTVTLLDT
ncbi:MAG: putative RNA polymerase sigma factor [Pseudolabrys sp.]|jgi:RNA polymerase sigma-70 factor (ECF subfamily)|nr:putative RNA polymerase sigma factor [Pseudolabrys sp.]